jgi:hypothetical protein
LKYIILLLTALCSLGTALAQPDLGEHSYNLFRPTPKDQMRGFETDRPDMTESAYTVDAGHFQLETDLFKTDRSSVDGIKTIQNSFNVVNLKLGLTNSLDIQFVAESFVSTKITDQNSTKTNRTFGNLAVRVKQNIWGNDQDKTALAILPFVNIPTTTDSKITGGIVVPFAVSLSNNWGFGSQIGADLEKNQLANGYHVNFLASATISHPLFVKCNFFVEADVYKESELKNYDYFLNAGLVYELKENIKLDTGMYYRLNNISPKTYFLGLSFRL